MCQNACFNRWAGTAGIAAVTLFLGSISFGSAADEKGIGFSLDKVSSGTDVPQVEVSLGMRPYANDLIFVAGIKQGFYKDVGLPLTPPRTGGRCCPNKRTP